MARSGKTDKSFQDKLKSFFKVGIRNQLPDPKAGDFILSNEIVTELGPEAPEYIRIKTMKELASIVRERRLQEHGVELLWVKLQDLVISSNDESRRETMSFFESVIRGQYSQLDIMRAQFFRLIKGPDQFPGGQAIKKDGDLAYRLNLLNALTESGRDILHFEDEIGKLIVQLFPPVLQHEDSGALYTDFMKTVLNIIQFNSAYLDQEVICALISFISHICVITNRPQNVSLCLQCLNAIICYSYIPKEGLVTYISTLCLVVNMESQCVESWKIIKNLMGTHLGHSALYSLCQIIQTEENHSNIALIRGAIFYIGMSLWSPQRVKTVSNYTATTILPTFVNALGCKHYLVIYEVTLQTERLVTKFGPTLKATSCDSALCLVELLLHEIPAHVPPELQPEVCSHLHNIITCFEGLSSEKKYLGSKHKLFHVVDLCSKYRPESSVILLINYRANMIYPTKPAWIRALCDLVEKYYKLETRSNIRIKALSVLMDTYKSNRHIYEEDLLERVVLPYLGTTDNEPSETVRLGAVKVLIAICSESLSRKCFNILDILQRVTQRPVEISNPKIKWEDHKLLDIRFVIENLINIFVSRIHIQPSYLVVKIYDLLVNHLEVNYDHPDIFSHVGVIREQIFRLFMRLRANDEFHLGVEGSDGVIRFSPYIICSEPSDGDLLPAAKPSAKPSVDKLKMVAHMSLTKACLMVIRCLSEELDWRVLKLVLVQVPAVLQNKAILSRYGSSIRAFVSPLIELTTNNARYPEALYNTVDESDQHVEGAVKKRLSRPEFHNQVFPVLAAMAPYNEHFDKKTAQSLIKALQSGLLSRECNRICIVALTACALEMKNNMYVLIPQIVLNFSKISPTKQIASPMLEFLSTLIRLPDTFSKFFPTDFMAVFAIALNFTNPLRFDPYTVALAHHVIIMWFLKCRLADRQNFVHFIVRSLNHNLVRSFEDSSGEFRKAAPSVTSTASSQAGRRPSAAAIVAANVTEKLRERSGSFLRQRSSSFSDNAKQKELIPVTPQLSVEEENFNKMMLFHQELSETCQDLLARYMFANVSVQQRRLPTADFLLKEGQSASWVLGAMVITITTSRCDHTSTRGGLCDRCYLICNPQSSVSHSGRHASSGDPSTVPLEPLEHGRRRHLSGFSKSPSKFPTSLGDSLDLRRPLDFASANASVSEKPEECRLEALLKKQKETEKRKPEMCACWCTGWAEIYVRRPSGDVSWMCRVQNGSLNSDSISEFPLADLTAILQPSMEPLAAKVECEKIALEGDDDCSGPLKGLPGSFSVFGGPNEDPGPTGDVTKTTELATKELPPNNQGLPMDEESKKQRQSWGPILEDDESEDKTSDPTRRRPSLQATKSTPVAPFAPLSPLHRPPSSSNATPPRTPVASVKEDPKGPNQFFAAQQQIEPSDQAQLGYRDRAHTVSGPLRSMSSLTQRRGSGSAPSAGLPTEQQPPKAEKASGISPQFVFLTLYHSFYSSGVVQAEDKPVLLPATKSIESSLKNIDRIHAHETHKIGVLYVGPGQADNENAILGNSFGSLRYTDFLHGLGKLISLHDVDKGATFLGGLDSSDGDGDFAYMWEDDVMQVIFHVATLMPTILEKDPGSNKKKRHIGNDFVTIVYNDTRNGQPYKLGTVKGHFIFAAVVITPLDQGSNRVEIQCKPELDEPLGHVKEPKIVSDRSLAIVVRQMALHCNLAAVIQKSLKSGTREPYASNWLERLRAIKRLRDKVLKELESVKDTKEKHENSQKSAPHDFTIYVLRNRDIDAK